MMEAMLAVLPFLAGGKDSEPGGLEGVYRRNIAFKRSIFRLYTVICWSNN